MNLKETGKKLLFPPPFVIVLLTLISTAALIFVFVRGLEQSPIAYITYVVSFYALSVICIFFAAVLPKRYKNIKQKIYDNPIGNKYMTDMVFRTHVSLFAALGINLLYSALNVVSFILYRSFWFAVLAVYYIILSVMRFLLVRYVRKTGIGKDRLGELKRSRLCAVILLTVNFALSGAVLMILYQDKGFYYHGILIYIMAAYTFYITAHAIANFIKYRRLGSPVMTTAKVIALCSALVSVLSLETAMLSRFGQDMAPENRWTFIALTGAVVAVTVIALSVYTIVCSMKEIKKIEEK